MTTPFLGEIQLFGFSYAPYQWAQCNGATLPVRQFTALFSLIGVTYGGDGTNSFQLPNLTARAACSQGTGPGLTQRQIGSTFGTATVALTQQQLPSHNHGFNVFSQSNQSLRTNVPVANSGLDVPGKVSPFLAAVPNTQFAPNMLATMGGNQPHQNSQPLLPINYCIAMYGAFPSFG